MRARVCVHVYLNEVYVLVYGKYIQYVRRHVRRHVRPRGERIERGEDPALGQRWCGQKKFLALGFGGCHTPRQALPQWPSQTLYRRYTMSDITIINDLDILDALAWDIKDTIKMTKAVCPSWHDEASINLRIRELDRQWANIQGKFYSYWKLTDELSSEFISKLSHRQVGLVEILEQMQSDCIRHELGLS